MRILQNPFLLGVFLSVECGIFPYIDMHGGQAIGRVRTVTFVLPLQLDVISSHFCPMLTHQYKAVDFIWPLRVTR